MTAPAPVDACLAAVPDKHQCAAPADPRGLIRNILPGALARRAIFRRLAEVPNHG